LSRSNVRRASVTCSVIMNSVMTTTVGHPAAASTARNPPALSVRTFSFASVLERIRNGGRCSPSALLGTLSLSNGRQRQSPVLVAASTSMIGWPRARASGSDDLHIRVHPSDPRLNQIEFKPRNTQTTRKRQIDFPRSPLPCFSRLSR